MANGYSMSIMGSGLNEPMVIPQGVINVIRVNENTPNLQMIQSFPVVSRNGNVHIHQDPSTGQMYEMTDEFHSMIPQIIARNGFTPNNVNLNQISDTELTTTTNQVMEVPEVVDKFTNTTALQTFSNLLSMSTNLNSLQSSINQNRINRPSRVFNVSGLTTTSTNVIQSPRDVGMSMDTEIFPERNGSLQFNRNRNIQNSGRQRHGYPMISSIGITSTSRVSTVSVKNRHAYPSI